jgi:hypothetical protein
VRNFSYLTLVKWKQIFETGGVNEMKNLPQNKSTAPLTESLSAPMAPQDSSERSAENLISSPQNPVAGANTQGPIADPGRGKRLGKDLRSNWSQALTSWEKLSVETAGKRSPEEDQLREMKKLLGELKNKIAEFE